MKPSEYGGSDTDKTFGIQPAPHALSYHEKARLMKGTDPEEKDVPPVAGLDPIQS